MIHNYDPMNPFGYRPEVPTKDDNGNDLSPEDQEALAFQTAAYGCATFFVAGLLALMLMLLLGSCTTTRYVTVPEVHEHWQHTTDTILQRDSIVSQQTTLIREVDSATMARYGIQMSALQTAWLIQTDRLQRELSELRQTKADTIVIRDSIPVPVEVIKEVPAPLTWWQQARLHLANILLYTLLIAGAGWLIRKYIKKK